jgi:hydrogenase maturation factor HypF (carbamoyltransferase family)
MPIDPYYEEVKEEQRKNAEGYDPYVMEIFCTICNKKIPVNSDPSQYEYEFYVVDQGYNVQGAVKVEITKDYIICHTCMEEMIKEQKTKKKDEE